MAPKKKKVPIKIVRKSTPLIIKKIDDPIYAAHLTFIIGDFDKALKYLKRCGVDIKMLEEQGANENSRGKFYYDPPYSIIWMPRVDLFSLVHELYHYTTTVLDTRGIPIRPENDEVGAYYIDMMFQRIAKALKIKSLIE